MYCIESKNLAARKASSSRGPFPGGANSSPGVR